MPKTQQSSSRRNPQPEKTKKHVKYETPLTETEISESDTENSMEYSTASTEEDTPPPKARGRARERSPVSSRKQQRSRSRSRTRGDRSPEASRSRGSRSQSAGRALAPINGKSSKTAHRDGRCTLVLKIYKIKGLDNITYKRDYITVSADLNGEFIKSAQLHRDDVNKKGFENELTFEWAIGSKEAKRFLDNPAEMNIEIVLKVEKDEMEAGNRWTHVVGTAVLPARQEKNPDSQGRRKIVLAPTKLEHGEQKVEYAIDIKIGKDAYKA